MKHYARISAVIVLVVALAAGSTSCVKPTTANIPGSVNNVDAQLYVALADARAALEEAKNQVPGFPALKLILNTNVIPAFNKASDAYTAYHEALAKGTSPAPNTETAIMAQITAIRDALAAALRNVGAKK